MNRGNRTLARSVLTAAATAALCLSHGCASLRKFKAVPDSVATCHKLSQEGVAALEAGDTARARDLLTRAVETSPRDLAARRQLADALWLNGERPLAVAQILAASEADPHHAATLVRAGEMLLETGRVDAALDRAEQAVAKDPTLAEAWEVRGRVRRRRGELNEALSDLHQALRYQPHSARVLLATAEIHYQLGKPQRCLTTLHHLLALYHPGEESQQALWLQGLAYLAVERPVESAESLMAASQRGPAPADLLFELAKAEQASGRSGEAIAAARRALSTDVSHQPSRALLASLGQLESTDAPILRR